MILLLRLLNYRTWMTLKTSVVIFQALETSAASLTSAASATSLASTASFPQKMSWSWWCDHHWHQNDQSGHFLWNGSSKTQYFTNIWYPFWQRLLRLAYVTFLKTGWWNSNAQASGIHRYLYFDQKVVFSWPQRSSKYVKSGRKTLYKEINLI